MSALNYYCYLDDAMGIDTSEKLIYCRTNGETVNNVLYKDPDGSSRQLYEDMMILFNARACDMKLKFKVVKGINPYKLYIETEKGEFSENYNCFSTDYIGPSRSKTGAKSNKVNACAKEIGDTLRACRTLGGHIFWPAYKVNKGKTINMARGGYIINDRIDYTLAELKNYLSDKNNKPKYSNKLFEAFGRYEKWFNLFGERGEKDTFEKYIVFFALEDFVKNEEVLDISSETQDTIGNRKCPSFDKDSYSKYSKNLCKLILARTKKLVMYAYDKKISIRDNKIL